MKIGIITTTFNNFGSRLQNIATVELLKEQYKGSKIKTIVVLKNKSKFIRFLGKIHFFCKLCLKLKFKGKVNKDNKLCNYKLYFVKDYSLESLRYLDKKYDLFVIGSDQIWNNLGEMSNFYFGMFTDKKICNSPSFVPECCKDVALLKEYLSSFKELNVREEATCRFINEQLGLKCNVLKDPTLRLTKDKWDSLLRKNKHNFKNFVFVYMLHKKEKYEQICNDLKIKNKLCLFNSNNGAEKYDYSPLEFAALISNSNKVITNSFHGACFATIFDKPLTIYKHNEPSDIRYDVFKSYKNLKNII